LNKVKFKLYGTMEAYFYLRVKKGFLPHNWNCIAYNCDFEISRFKFIYLLY